MLKIRLARMWRKKLPFYQVVLTEHTKKPQAWFKEKLWWFNPLKHESSIDADAVKLWISKWANPSPRVAKLLFSQTKDDFFKKFYEEWVIERKTRNPEKYD